MKAFQFSLERVLEWRASQLILEEAELRRLNHRANALEQTAARLEQSRLEAQKEVRGAQQVSGWDLKTLEAYCRQADRQTDLIRNQIIEARKLAAAQHQKLLAARREHRLVEKLRERRLAEWNAELSKEIDLNASESHLARWVREK